MIEIISVDTAHPEKSETLQRILGRNIGLNAELMARTDAIVRDVTTRGDAALIEYTGRFDGVQHTPETIRASRETIEELIGRPYDLQQIHVNLVTLTGHIDEDDDQLTLSWKH